MMFDKFKNRFEEALGSSGLDKNSYDPYEKLRTTFLVAFLIWVLSLFM